MLRLTPQTRFYLRDSPHHVIKGLCENKSHLLCSPCVAASGGDGVTTSLLVSRLGCAIMAPGKEPPGVADIGDCGALGGGR